MPPPAVSDDQFDLLDVLGHATPEWNEAVTRGLTRLIELGEPFEAYDLERICGVPSPDHANRWGAAIQHAAKAGLIVKYGYRRSSRPTGKGTNVCTWIGANR